VVGPEPLERWRTAPFSPALRGRFLYGRGASDDKGPLLCHVAAIAAWLAATGRLPVNVRCVFEGEEEIGSPHLAPVLRRIAGDGVDAAVISDTRMLGPGQPTLIVGLRGGLAAELEVSGPERDLHSGAFGGAVHNPADVLCELVASLHDTEGRVAVPDFYRRVRARPAPVAPAPERRASRALLGAAGARWAFGERGYTAYEQTAFRPALGVSGLDAGHTGGGVKSIIPSRARAKLTLRLVPDQSPREIGALLHAHLASRAPPSARVALSLAKPAHPVSIDPSAPALRAAAHALRAGFGASPALLASGGTIPVVELLSARLRIPTALMGFARPDDGMHAPNERVDLDALAAGTRACIYFLDLLAATAPRPRSRPRAVRGAA
jgi:acetylornithine deacetylase/succinyl-diaminopimelate desuccinylase-like protein